MAIDFKNVTKIIGPGGKEVSKITRTSDGVILWQKSNPYIIDNVGKLPNVKYIYRGSDPAITFYQNVLYQSNYWTRFSVFGSGTLYIDFDFTVMSGVTVPISGKKLKFGNWLLSQSAKAGSVNLIKFYNISDNKHTQGNLIKSITTYSGSTVVSDLSDLTIDIPNNSYGIRVIFTFSRSSSNQYHFAYMRNVNLV